MEIVQPTAKKFTRNIEDFVCEECEMCVYGDGYRNHCPRCLISKHVDVNPGDRAAGCGGVMDVVDIFLDHGKLVLTHKCRVCGHTKNNKAHAEDSIETVTKLMAQIQKNR